MNNKIVFLPGLDEQVKFLLSKENIEGMKILVIGSASEVAALRLSKKSKTDIDVIVEDFDSFINSRLILEGSSGVNVKLMDFETTDFKDAYFDLVFAQASISSPRRTKIIKEIKRILKPKGIFCVAELVILESDIPNFLKNMFEASDIEPLQKIQLNDFYLSRDFVVNESKNLNHYLFEFYKLSKRELDKAEKDLADNEKSYYKKLLNKISHETNIYLKQGAERYVGLQALIMRKK
jgi:ubiquinone/menaquinone biosynthesis C-methylase UbiE